MEYSNPVISVIVPTCERSRYLSRALDSIYSQTWPHFEVILIDDNIPGSEEQLATQEIIRQYVERGNLLYLKTSGKIGGGAARNLGIQHCHGEYVAFLDDDDRYLPEKLEKQVRFMQERDLDMSYQDVRWHDTQERTVEYRKMDYTQDFSKESLLRTHILYPICPTSIYMIRREKLLETEGFGEVPSGQDYILMLRCIESGMKMEYMPGAWVVQYLHEGARISLGKTKIMGENNLYRIKHQYFSILTPAEREYVRFRHYAVLAFSSMRSHRLFYAVQYALMTIFSSPRYCVKETKRYFGQKLANR